jgi:hypothetical protein
MIEMGDAMGDVEATTEGSEDVEQDDSSATEHAERSSTYVDPSTRSVEVGGGLSGCLDDVRGCMSLLGDIGAAIAELFGRY